MEIADKPFPSASKPQALPHVVQPAKFDKSFNISLSHERAMALLNRVVEEFVQANKVHALGFGIFQVNDRQLAELNEAIKEAFQNFTL